MCLIVAFAILLEAPFGTLTGPGLFAAVLGTGLVLAGRFTLVGAVGILTAAGSFGAQALTSICSTCTSAAVAFALAGVIALLQVLQERPVVIASLAAVLVGSLICYSGQGYFDSRLFAQSNGPRYSIESTEYTGPGGDVTVRYEGKALLFISTTCPSCHELVEEFIKADPQGLTWQPIIVPTGYLDEGRDWLTDAGYTGIVLADKVAPNHMVPSLMDGKQTFNGRSAIEESSFYADNITK